jgi:uncharacterized protein
MHILHNMSEMLSLWIVISVFLISTFVRSAIGFGDALLAMPFLILTVGIKTATPLVALIAATISLILLIKKWHLLSLHEMWKLILATFLGIPFGLILLNCVPEDLVKAVLGMLLILYGLYGLLGLAVPQIQDKWWASASFGFAAGVLGGGYNISGVPMVLYGTLRRWTPNTFRINLQGYFFVTNCLIAVSHGLSGLWTLQVLQLYAYSLPSAILGIFVGEILGNQIQTKVFSQLTYVLLILIGILFVV